MEGNYALKLGEDGRILYATRPEFAYGEVVFVETLPEGDITDYRYVGGEYIYDPIPVESEEETPSQLDVIEA